MNLYLGRGDYASHRLQSGEFIKNRLFSSTNIGNYFKGADRLHIEIEPDGLACKDRGRIVRELTMADGLSLLYQCLKS